MTTQLPSKRTPFRIPWWVGCVLLASIALFFLWEEHRAHILSAWALVVMFGFLLQWPTLVTLVMFPILVVTYVRLAHREEHEVEAEFGEAWRAYAAATPRCWPRFGAPPAGNRNYAGGAP